MGVGKNAAVQIRGQRFAVGAVQTIRSQQGHAVGTALTGCFHASHRCARRRSQIPLGHARRFEDAAVAEQGIHSHIFLAQNFQPHRQRGKGGIDVGAHKVGQRKRTVRAAQQQGDARVQVGDALAGNIVDGRDAAAVRRTVQRFVEQEGKQRTFVDVCPAQCRALGQQIDPGVQIAGAVVAVDHGDRRAVGGRDHVDFRVDSGQRLFQDDHGKNAGTCADIAGARGDTVCCHHAGAGVALRWAERYAGLQRAGGIEPLRPLDGQHTGVLACGQNGRQQFDKIHGAALLVCQRVKFCKHCGVIPAGGAVDREHAAGIALAQHLAPGQLPVYIACQRGEKVQLRQVWLAVQHGLVQVRYAPALRDVEPERRGQFFCCRAGHRVAPCAERYQQFARSIKRQIPMHHSRNANAPHRGQRLAALGQHIRSQCRVGSLHTLPDFLQRVGPDAVFQPVLPGKIALSHRLAGIAHKHSFDAGGTQLNAERTLL